VLGILIRNIYVFGLPSMAYSLPLLWSGERLADISAWAFVELFVDGAMRALFSILFGASAMLLLSKGEIGGIGEIDYFYRRLMWLMAFGLIHAYLLLSTVDILFIYGILGLMIFPLRNLRARTLLIVAGLLLMITAVSEVVDVSIPSFEGKKTAVSHVETPAVMLAGLRQFELPDAGGMNDGAGGANEDGTTEELDAVGEALGQTWIAEALERRQGYLFNVVSLAEASLSNHSTELFKTHVFDVGSMILVGMALFKLGVVTGARTTGFYVILLVLGYGLGLTVNFSEIYTELPFFQDEQDLPGWTSMSYDVGRVGVALGHLALIVLLTRMRLASFFVNLFAAAGCMALTNYLLQTVICTTLFFGFGFGLFGNFKHSELLLIALAIGTVQLVASRLYLLVFSQGPMEWLIRRLIVWNGGRAAVPAL